MLLTHPLFRLLVSIHVDLVPILWSRRNLTFREPIDLRRRSADLLFGPAPTKQAAARSRVVVLVRH
jgi:hypothetical protein